jgi:hypothetical protein
LGPNHDASLLTWAGGLIGRLAKAAYAERELPASTLDPARLADAIEEAGAGPEFLDHLRGPGPYYAGCHLVDAILGKV